MGKNHFNFTPTVIKADDTVSYTDPNGQRCTVVVLNIFTKTLAKIRFNSGLTALVHTDSLYKPAY